MNDQIGVFTGVSFEEYQAIDALNGSSLVNLRKSPMYYRHCLDHPEPPTEAMILGTATHRMVLEPARVGDLAVWGGIPEHFTEKGNMRPRNGKDWESFKLIHADKLIVTAEQRDAMVGMAIGARRNVPIMKYAGAKGPSEVSLVWVDPTSKRRFKGRIDKLIPIGHTIFDLKTTRNCQKYRFGGQAYQLGYHIKMAIYSNGYKTLTGHEPHMKLGAIESKAPHESAVYRVTTDVLLQGFDDLDILLQTLEKCEQANEWPAAQPDEAELTLPTYAFTQPDEDLSDLSLVEE